ncbi:PREDICTED: uncharacterized protein LOC104802363 isoform X1 [Tarenaya hassleriana]|uniref:uncharacterized protein LOC104802363 isoform X1 n=1 Tax=Tarenaya hassleriana TaxID=28532 RepID=UPI00053C2447|nr:PREDICTED: uncharacterized protein LOC104802363 isoform X1 [Tarenaya hassleriana]
MAEIHEQRMAQWDRIEEMLSKLCRWVEADRDRRNSTIWLNPAPATVADKKQTNRDPEPQIDCDQAPKNLLEVREVNLQPKEEGDAQQHERFIGKGSSHLKVMPIAFVDRVQANHDQNMSIEDLPTDRNKVPKDPTAAGFPDSCNGRIHNKALSDRFIGKTDSHMKKTIPVFDDSFILEWDVKTERYFGFGGCSDKEMFYLDSTDLGGEALMLFNGQKKIGKCRDWEIFRLLLYDRCGTRIELRRKTCDDAILSGVVFRSEKGIFLQFGLNKQSDWASKTYQKLRKQAIGKEFQPAPNQKQLLADLEWLVELKQILDSHYTTLGKLGHEDLNERIPDHQLEDKLKLRRAVLIDVWVM